MDTELIVTIVQLFIFFLAWMLSQNSDPRYFLSAAPLFVFLLCYALHHLASGWLTGLCILFFTVQWIGLTAGSFGVGFSNSAYGMFRSISHQPEEGALLLRHLSHLIQTDTALVLDLNPELGVAEMKMEMAEENFFGQWTNAMIDVGSLLDIQGQEIDRTKLNADTSFQRLRNIDHQYYITLRKRLSTDSLRTELTQIDRYNAASATVRWKLADLLFRSALYKEIPLADYPELLVLKRKEE